MPSDADDDPKLEDKLAVRYVPIDTLIPYARNARTHSDAQVAQIAGSIREFGFNNPVLVDGDKGIIAGHGRVLAARKLDMAEVPVIELAHLSETQRKAYILADNRLALNAGWDNDLLGLELTELGAAGIDLSLLGFDTGEVDVLLNGWAPDMGKIDKTPAELTDLQATVKVKCPQEATEKVIDVIRAALHEAGITDAQIDA